MDFLNFLGQVSAPTGLWAKLINWLEGGIANYAVVLIVLTLLIKTVMLPLDFYNKIVTKKNATMQIVMKPEMDKINKMYANNPNMKNQKISELYKKNNFNIYGTCFGMLIYMVLTMVIFFTLFSTLNKMSAYKLYQEYDILNQTYIVAEETARTDYNANPNTEITIDDYATAKAEEAVVNKYGEIKNGFLWIKNIWRPDTCSKVTLSYNSFIKTTKISSEEITQENYEKIMNPIQQNYKGWNGYFLLAVINGGLSFLSMYLSELVSKTRAKRKGLPYLNTMNQNKSMTIIMPIIMALFMIFYNSAFGIYIITGSLFTCITSPFITMIIDAIYEKKTLKNNKKDKPEYSR